VALPLWHLARQRPVVTALVGTAARAVLVGRGEPPTGAAPSLPGPIASDRVSPRAPSLVRDYVRHVGGDPAAYHRSLPPHLFPQWTFPALARTLRGLPYPVASLVIGGCRLTVNGALPADAPLVVRAWLEGVDDDGRRAVLHQRVTTGPEARPDAVVADVYAVLPSGRGPRREKAGRDPQFAPASARELGYFRIPADAGAAFAMLTGDINPVHWSRRYARALGFRRPILHGFSTLARAIEGLGRTVFAGAVERLGVVDVRLTRPLLLPAEVGLYLGDDHNTFYVADAPGGPAYLIGTFAERAA
jgi:hypothetical protein